MRVAVLTSFYPNGSEPHRAPYVRNLVAALARHCEAIEIIAPVPYALPAGLSRWRKLGHVLRREVIDGRVVHHPRYAAVPKLDPLSGVAYFAGVLPTLRAVIRRFQPDVLHIHCAYPDAVGGALAALAVGIPYVVTAHGSDINRSGERFLLRPQIRAALRRAARVIAVSQPLHHKIIALVGRDSGQVVQVPCAGYDPQLFRLRAKPKLRSKLKVAPHGRLVVFAGELVPVKGLTVLLHAWRVLVGRGVIARDDTLAIVGDGQQRQILQTIASGIDGATIRFTGTLPQTAVADWLGAADLVCLPSHSEGTPNLVVESLASGTPVVASRVGGIPNLLAADCGRLVTPGRAGSLADALADALRHRWEPDRLVASVAHLSWAQLAARNAEVLRNAIGRVERYVSAVDA